MIDRIEIAPRIKDTRAEVKKKKIRSMGFDVKEVDLNDVYTLNNIGLSPEKIASMLSNPITQVVSINKPCSPKKFDYAIEIGFLPGVTDNIGTTAKEIIEDHFKANLEGQGVYNSQVMFLTGNLTSEDAVKIGEAFSNPVIQRASVKSLDEFMKDKGMDIIMPKVKLHEEPSVDSIEIQNASDDELTIIGKQGIANKDGSRRGPLSMDLIYMKTVQNYFKNLGLLPALNNQYGQRQAALVHNESARYLDRWVDLEFKGNSPWTQGIDKISLPIAHGEGNFYANPEILHQIKKKGLNVATYVEGDICEYQNLAANPNGSLENIAGITDETGKIFGLMPHPERAIFFTQLPHWTFLKEKYKREGIDLPEEADGLKIFRNGVNYFR